MEKQVELRIMSMDRTKRNQLFEKTVRSKTVLSFGYLSFYQLYCLRQLNKLCCCVPNCLKRRRQNQSKLLHRNNNAKSKLAQELDILNIVRDLRVSRFLTNLWLTPYQQQMVDYFKQYSLENKSIRPSDWKNYS